MPSKTVFNTHIDGVKNHLNFFLSHLDTLLTVTQRFIFDNNKALISDTPR